MKESGRAQRDAHPNRKCAVRVGHPKWWSLSEGGHGGVYSGADACGPAGGYGFEAGVEADSFGAVDRVVAEEGALPASERVERHGDGDGDVDAYHSGLHAAGEVAGGVSVAGEEGGSVAELVLVDELEGFFEGVDANDSEDGTEDLFAVDLHFWFDVVEEGGSEEEAVAFGCGLAAVDDELGTFFSAELDVAGNLVAVDAGDEWAEVGFGGGFGTVADFQVGDAGF